MQVIGGSHGGVTIQALYDGGKPDAVYFPPERPLALSAYWVNYNMFGPDGYPLPGSPEGVVTYSWSARCNGKSFQLTAPKQATVPVDWGRSHHAEPAALARDHGRGGGPAGMPRQGQLGGVHGRLVLQHDFGTGGSAANNTWFTSALPADVPAWDPAYDADGNAILFRVGKEGEIEEVERSGHLSEQPLGRLRYFFTNCETARTALAEIRKDVGDRVGLIRVRTPSDLLEDKVGGIYQNTGVPPIVGWAVGKVTGQRLEAQVVQDPENDCTL